MPTYEYRCDNGHTFEVVQRMTDDTLKSCSTCKAPVQRVFHPVAVHFKGSGFYTTDYGKKKAAAGSNNDSSEPKKSESKDSSQGSKDSSKESKKSDSSKKSD